MLRANLLILLALKVHAAPDLDWWKNAVFYQIYPRSFMDSDNDGIGDLKGIQSKLDHLVDAGVTALWLSPIYKSPQVDHGYDISDYRDVDPLFGTLEDFKALLQDAHLKGLKVILDFVPNHSSDQHDWFKKSIANDPKYGDYYVWKPGKDGNTNAPTNWISYFHGPAWKYNEVRGLWYLHQFSEGQPDLNYRSAELVAEMEAVLTFWLELGVDGFRVDIISALFEDEQLRDEEPSGILGVSENDREFLVHTYTDDQPENYQMVYRWRKLLDEYQRKNGGDARVMMTESYAPLNKLFGYYGNDKENGAHFTFNFWFITQLDKDSSAHDIKFVIDKWLTYMPWQYTANWVLGNHDQHRVATRYGVKRVDGLCMLSMLLPGIAVTYNGEEIGMEDGQVTWEEAQDPQACNGEEKDFLKNGRDFQRTPYQWDSSTNAGFTGESTKPWLPVSSNYKKVNLAVQKDDLNSHYRIYQQVVQLRKTNTLKYGNIATIAFSDSVLGLTRFLKDEKTYVLVINIANQPSTVNLSYFGNLPDSLTVFIRSQSKKQINDTVNARAVDLQPYESIILTTP